MHSPEDMKRLFPILSAPEPAPNNEDWEQEDIEARRGPIGQMSPPFSG